MAIRNILAYPHPLLQKLARPVQNFDADLAQLAADMLETMRLSNGIGLAAPQVGELKRLIVVEVPTADLPVPVYTVCNPEITRREGQARMEEGCLSVPGFQVEVDRAASVTVQGQHVDGSHFSLDATGLLAICFQHEIDHLDGKLILQFVSSTKREMYRAELKRRLDAGENFSSDPRNAL